MVNFKLCLFENQLHRAKLFNSRNITPIALNVWFKKKLLCLGKPLGGGQVWPGKAGVRRSSQSDPNCTSRFITCRHLRRQNTGAPWKGWHAGTLCLLLPRRFQGDQRWTVVMHYILHTNVVCRSIIILRLLWCLRRKHKVLSRGLTGTRKIWNLSTWNIDIYVCIVFV